MTELERINERLQQRKSGIRVVIEKVYCYDSDATEYNSWLEYFNTRRQSWGVLHNVGKFKTQKAALDAAREKLYIDKYL